MTSIGQHSLLAFENVGLPHELVVIVVCEQMVRWLSLDRWALWRTSLVSTTGYAGQVSRKK